MAETLSLSELQIIIRDSLYMAMPDTYWVVAEIAEIKKNQSGHCYLELVEKQPGDINVRARIKAIIWSSRYRFLNSYFTSSTGDAISEGMKVLVRCRVEYHEIYGLSLIITDIDPSYTAGEMARRKQQIIKRLEQEGIFTMNKEIEFPLVPRRVAVISSINAAGYRDFINHLEDNNRGYVFHTKLFEAVMQGAETGTSVISALDMISEREGDFDVVVIIRGGGSQGDLSWFDNYDIAYHITQFPLPVITGIGHEKDMSVADLVAFRSCKTPTAAADFIIEHVINTETRLDDISRAIKEHSISAINRHLTSLDALRMKLVPFARLLISDHKEKLSRSILELLHSAKEHILREKMIPANQESKLITSVRSFMPLKKSILDNLRLSLKNNTINRINRQKNLTLGHENSLQFLDPVNVLKRGYTITTLNGKIIRSMNQADVNKIIGTRFSDGDIKSRVISNKNK